MKSFEHSLSDQPKEVAPGRGPSFATLSNGYENNFNFLRFVLAALVIYCHSHPLLLGDRSRDILGRLTRGQLDFGDLAVNGFFVISGFLITGSWLRSRGIKDFLKKRILRIYPGFAVASLFCVLVVGPSAAAHLPVYLENLDLLGTVKRILLLREPNQAGAFPGLHFAYLNGSLWTIKYEFWCYLLVAGLGLLGALRLRALVLVLFAASLLAYGFLTADPAHHRPVGEPMLLENIIGSLYHWPRFLTFFLAGAVFFLFREKIPFSRNLLALSCVALLVGLWKWMAFALPIFGGYALLYAAFNRRWKLQEFGRLGDFSYGLYLYAWPVQQLLLYHARWDWNPHTLFAAAFVVTLGLAVVSWHLVEKPFLKMKLRTRAARAATGIGMRSLEAEA